MSGIVGYIDWQKTSEDYKLIRLMRQAIQYLTSDVIDRWSDGYLNISRVHHGILNPEKQPIFNKDHSLVIFMDGEVFDYNKDKMFLIKKGILF